jgi:hypothetical protein
MRLYEFLALVLKAHAQVLKMLAEYHGTSGAVHVLEMGSSTHQPPIASVAAEAREGSIPWDLAFERIESSVRELALSEELESWVWTYPYYRAFVESGAALTAPLYGGQGPRSDLALVEEAYAFAQSWLKHLELPEDAAFKIQRAADQIWVRFRSEALKQLGQAPLGRISP